MTLENTLYSINELNQKLGGDNFFQEPLNEDLSELARYFSTIAVDDFLIGLEGNSTYFLSESVSKQIFYMFQDFLNKNETVIAQQQDTHIIYIGDDQKVYAVLAGDDSHLLADTLSNFFQAILTTQNFLLECNLEKFDDDFSYRDKILSQIKDKILSQIKDPNYFIEFFYG